MEDISIRYWTRVEGSWKKEPRRVQCERRKLLKSNIIIVFSFAGVWQVPWWTFWFQEECWTNLVGSSFPSLVLIVVVFLTWPRKTMPATIEDKWGSFSLGLNCILQRSIRFARCYDGQKGVSPLTAVKWEGRPFESPKMSGKPKA